MSTFAPATARDTILPDPYKHVNYTLGMVLGVDDFRQEFLYHAARDRALARDLIGYGTVSGLRVSIGTDRTPFEVVVSAGIAVTPTGELVRVQSAQCARLNEWLAANQAALLAKMGSPIGGSPIGGSPIGGSPIGGGFARIYVTLAYRDCATDQVPIPGEPCRSENDAMAPSRLADDFRLEISLDAPDQREEDADRNFLQALGQMQVTDAPGSFNKQEDVINAVRAFGQTLTSPLSSPIASPLGSPFASLRIHTFDALTFLRAAWRVWTTDVRPRYLNGEAGAVTANVEEKLLLAALVAPLTLTGGIWMVADPNTIKINEERRPYLVSLRYLQEAVLNAGRSGGSAPALAVSLDGDVTGPPGTNTLRAIKNVPVIVPPGGLQPDMVLTFKNGNWQGAAIPPPAPQVVPNLGGDLSGALGTARIERIQNVQVTVPSPPTEGQLLTAQGGRLTLAPAEFVEHPAGLRRYVIAAAGIVRVSANAALPPTYNGLRAELAGTDIRLTFDKIAPQPGERKFAYVVKALPTALDQQMLLVNLVRIQADQILVRVVNANGTAVNAQLLPNVELSVEVSKYYIE